MAEAAAHPPASKICVVCGVDCADKPRVKDATGRYMCKACAEKQTAAKPATAVKPGGAKPAAPKPADKGPIAVDGYDPVMASLVASSQQATSQACPNCKGWVKEGQLLCTSCGFNLEEGKQIRTRVQKERAVKEKKERSGPVVPDAFAPLIWVGGAAAGAALGAVIWYFVASSIDPDTRSARKVIALAAAVVGGCAGLGATAAARNTAGMGSGLVAMCAAVVGLGVGRYFALRELLDSIGMGGWAFEEWYFKSIDLFDLIGAVIAMVAAWKVGSTGVIGGDD